jgi:hypothetical protein
MVCVVMLPSSFECSGLCHSIPTIKVRNLALSMIDASYMIGSTSLKKSPENCALQEICVWRQCARVKWNILCTYAIRCCSMSDLDRIFAANKTAATALLSIVGILWKCKRANEEGRSGCFCNGMPNKLGRSALMLLETVKP